MYPSEPLHLSQTQALPSSNSMSLAFSNARAEADGSGSGGGPNGKRPASTKAQSDPGLTWKAAGRGNRRALGLDTSVHAPSHSTMAGHAQYNIRSRSAPGIGEQGGDRFSNGHHTHRTVSQSRAHTSTGPGKGAGTTGRAGALEGLSMKPLNRTLSSKTKPLDPLEKGSTAPGSYEHRPGQITPRGPRIDGSGSNRRYGKQARQNGQHRQVPMVERPEEADHWKSWTEVTINAYNLEPGITTGDLYETFKEYGNLNKIDISQGFRCFARITYRPPPVRAFWENHDYKDIKLSLAERKVLFALHPLDPKKKLPERIVLFANSVDFGFMFDEKTMTRMYTAVPQAGIANLFELNLLRRHIHIQFPVNTARDSGPKVAHDKSASPPKRAARYCFRIPLEQLQRVHEIQIDQGTKALLVSLETPPNFYRKADDIQQTHDEGSVYWTEWDTWLRQTDIVDKPENLRSATVTLKKVRPIIDIGRWTTYRFIFSVPKSGEKVYNNFLSGLRDFNIEVLPAKDLNMAAPSLPPVWTWIDKPKVVESFSAEMAKDVVPQLSFPTRYQLEVCVSQGCLNEYNLTKEFILELEKLDCVDSRKATALLEYVADQKSRVYNPMSIFEITDFKSKSSTKIPHYCTYARKATVTPSTVYFSTPTVETSNRVTRQWWEHNDRFLRVQFTDEKFQGRIHFTDKNTNNELFTRIKRTLRNGISIGDRHFEFLAFGNSQFREHGAFFFSPTQGCTTERMRQWMGDFRDIKVIAKHAARLGQCFSTTRAINAVPVRIVEIPDISRNGHTFSDGVGKISPFLAQMIASVLDLNVFPEPPSVFQFRLGGCKGVLTVWPNVHQRDIHIRPSQYKFPAVHNGLEIIRWSQHAAATLNRQLIVILSALGVRDAVFKTKVKEMLADLSQAMDDRSVALRLLNKNVDPNQMTIEIAGFILDGFMDRKELFVSSLLRLWRAWSIKYLKEKAKIFVEHGAFVLGCVDETASLKGHHNKPTPHCGSRPLSIEEQMERLPEIFIQVPCTGRKNQYKIIEGICVLARNPSLHPGDIRVVRAVNIPALKHLRDVVVLPQVGDRDLAGMCSGGDLDGDDYLVIWDPDFLPTIWNHEPMDYTPPKAVELKREVAIDDITSFFVNYMKNDRLGSIANAHLVWADKTDEGPLHDKCLRLAALHSVAVDYVKTGQPAQMPRELRIYKWPHFMEKNMSKEKTYVSGKILGQLYDMVQRVDFAPDYDCQLDSRILTAYPVLSEDILDRARTIKAQYDQAIKRIMAQHNIGTEFEIFSTFVLSHHSSTNDYKFHEEMGAMSKALRDRFRAASIQSAGGKDFSILGPFVAAMYIVTKKELDQALEECKQTKIVLGREVPVRRKVAKSMPLISFPWIFKDVLGKIANEGRPLDDAAKETCKKGAEKEHAQVSIQPNTTDMVVQDKQDAALENALMSRSDAVSQGRRLFEEDTLQTEGGITHRGEVLELFTHGDDSAEAYQTTSASSAAETVTSSVEAQDDVESVSIPEAANGSNAEVSGDKTEAEDTVSPDLSRILVGSTDPENGVLVDFSEPECANLVAAGAGLSTFESRRNDDLSRWEREYFSSSEEDTENQAVEGKEIVAGREEGACEEAVIVDNTDRRIDLEGHEQVGDQPGAVEYNCQSSELVDINSSGNVVDGDEDLLEVYQEASSEVFASDGESAFDKLKALMSQ